MIKKRHTPTAGPSQNKMTGPAKKRNKKNDEQPTKNQASKTQAVGTAPQLTGFEAFLARKSALAQQQGLGVEKPTVVSGMAAFLARAANSSNAAPPTVASPNNIKKDILTISSLQITQLPEPVVEEKKSNLADKIVPIDLIAINDTISSFHTNNTPKPAPLDFKAAIRAAHENAKFQQERNKRLVFRERDILVDKRNDAAYLSFLHELEAELSDSSQPSCIFIRGGIGTGKRTSLETACKRLGLSIVRTLDGLSMASLTQFRDALVPALIQRASLAGAMETQRQRLIPFNRAQLQQGNMRTETRRVVLVRHLDVSPMLRSIKPNELAKTVSVALTQAGSMCALVFTTCGDNSYQIPGAKRSLLQFPKALVQSIDACLQHRWSEDIDVIQSNSNNKTTDTLLPSSWVRRIVSASSDGDIRHAVAQYRFSRRVAEEPTLSEKSLDPVYLRQTMQSLSKMLPPEKQAAYLIHMILTQKNLDNASRTRLMLHVCRARQLMHQPEHLARQLSVSRAAELACDLGITRTWVRLQGIDSLKSLLIHETELVAPPGFHTVHRNHLVTRRFVQQTRTSNMYSRNQDTWMDPMEDSQFIFGYLSPILAHQLLAQCESLYGNAHAPLPQACKTLGMCGSTVSSQIIQSHALNKLRTGQSAFYKAVRERVAEEAKRICKDDDD